MIRAKGKILVDAKENRIVVELNRDFVGYYIWFFKKHNWLNLHTPKHNGHITLANSKLHPKVNYKHASIFNGQTVNFSYDPSPICGGRSKGFTMYYLRVFSQELDILKKKLGVIDNSGYRGLHITLGNLNKNGQTPILYWPEMIEIKK